MIPWKIAKTYPYSTRDAFDILGIKNINDDKILQGINRSINRGQLNTEWNSFINNNPKATGKDIVNKYNELADKYVNEAIRLN